MIVIIIIIIMFMLDARDLTAVTSSSSSSSDSESSSSDEGQFLSVNFFTLKFLFYLKAPRRRVDTDPPPPPPAVSPRVVAFPVYFRNRHFQPCNNWIFYF